MKFSSLEIEQPVREEIRVEEFSKRELEVAEILLTLSRGPRRADKPPAVEASVKKVQQSSVGAGSSSGDGSSDARGSSKLTSDESLKRPAATLHSSVPEVKVEREELNDTRKLVSDESMRREAAKRKSESTNTRDAQSLVPVKKRIRIVRNDGEHRGTKFLHVPPSEGPKNVGLYSRPSTTTTTTTTEHEGLGIQNDRERRGTKFLHAPPSEGPKNVAPYSSRPTKTRTAAHDRPLSRVFKHLEDMLPGGNSRGPTTITTDQQRSSSNFSVRLTKPGHYTLNSVSNSSSIGKDDKRENKVEYVDEAHKNKKLKLSVDIRPMDTSSTRGADVDRSKLVSGAETSFKQNVQESRYECNVCGRSFTNPHALGGHKSSHFYKDGAAEQKKPKAEENHVCEICHRGFPTGVALGGHKRLHYKKPSEPEAPPSVVAIDNTNALASSQSNHDIAATGTSSSLPHSQENKVVEEAAAATAIAATDAKEVNLTLALALPTSNSKTSENAGHGKIKFNFDLNELPEE